MGSRKKGKTHLSRTAASPPSIFALRITSGVIPCRPTARSSSQTCTHAACAGAAQTAKTSAAPLKNGNNQHKREADLRRSEVACLPPSHVLRPTLTPHSSSFSDLNLLDLHTRTGADGIPTKIWGAVISFSTSAVLSFKTRSIGTPRFKLKSASGKNILEFSNDPKPGPIFQNYLLAFRQAAQCEPVCTCNTA